MGAAPARFLKVLVGATLLACALGIALDLVTANLAVEYFSVHHPHVVDSENPWVLALVWGVIASWWFGTIGGAVLGWINHRRPEPLEPKRILKWVAVACGVLWVLMIGVVIVVYSIAGLIPEAERGETFEHDRRLVAVAVAHQTEYVLGALAVVVVGVMTWRVGRGGDKGVGSAE